MHGPIISKVWNIEPSLKSSNILFSVLLDITIYEPIRFFSIKSIKVLSAFQSYVVQLHWFWCHLLSFLYSSFISISRYNKDFLKATRLLSNSKPWTLVPLLSGVHTTPLIVAALWERGNLTRNISAPFLIELVKATTTANANQKTTPTTGKL